MTVDIMLDLNTNKISIRLPGKGRRWQRGFKNVDEAVRVALKELPDGFTINYVANEEETKP